MKRLAATVLFVVTLVFAWPPAPIAQEKSPGAGPVIVLETDKGIIEFETYPDEAPKTVARIVETLVLSKTSSGTTWRIEMTRSPSNTEV